MKTTLFASLSGAIRNALIVMTGFMLAICASPATAANQYGVRCEDVFQNNWVIGMEVTPACSAFIKQVGSANVDFYFNLHGAAPAFEFGNSKESSKSWGGVDSVDFFLLATEGGYTSTAAEYAMWDENSMASTSNMRLGDSGRQVKVFASFTCFTFMNSDGLFWKRWQYAFRGGLKLGLGGHGLLFDSNESTLGEDFAIYMQEGATIGSAWLNAFYNANSSNETTVGNTGANSTDCWNRQGVTLNNLASESTLRDGQIGYVCWTNWN
jgi:Family of unknown function (DUF6345)